MTKIPEKPTSTAHLIYETYEAQQLLEPTFRQHLGASIIGDPCRRKLWYTFRGATRAKFPGRVLRLFETGQLAEERFANDLRAIGCEVITVDPETGEQFRVTDCGGHFGGSMDGALVGLPEAPARWHVVEMKTHNDKSFKALVKDGVEKSKPLHAAQMQVYMHLTGMPRALYIAVNKNNDEIYTERLHHSKQEAETLITKAKGIIEAPEPLERVSERPDWYECKFCDHQAICHQQRCPEVHCRTCAHSTLRDNGTWICEYNDNDVLSYEDQLAGCPDHLLIPALIPYAEMDELDEYGVRYRMTDGRVFWNSVFSPKPEASCYTSHELQNLNHALISNSDIESVRNKFNARVVK